MFLRLYFTGPHVIEMDGGHGAAPSKVKDVKSGLHGTIDYDGATVLSDDNENGVFLLPIRVSDGSWAVMVWKLDGEFDIYEGIRRV